MKVAPAGLRQVPAPSPANVPSRPARGPRGRAAVARALLGPDRRRARLRPWAATAAVYAVAGVVMAVGAQQGVMRGQAVAGWCLFTLLGLAGFYGLIRSGASERYSTATLGEAQAALALAAVVWAYLICGAWRSAALFPVTLVFTFAALTSTDWRRLAALTAMALGALLVAVAVLHFQSARGIDWRAELANLFMLAALLPAASVLAARLATLRRRLDAQRERLTEALAEVERLATQDPVTGLKNRRRMQELLDLEHRRAVRSGRTFCIAVLRLDGARAGDAESERLLHSFAGRAAGVLRASDVLGRWDEGFLLMMPDTRAGLARIGVDRLREQAEAMAREAGAAAAGVVLLGGVVEHRAGESVDEAVLRAGRAVEVSAGPRGARVAVG